MLQCGLAQYRERTECSPTFAKQKTDHSYTTVSLSQLDATPVQQAKALKGILGGLHEQSDYRSVQGLRERRKVQLWIPLEESIDERQHTTPINGNSTNLAASNNAPPTRANIECDNHHIKSLMRDETLAPLSSSVDSKVAQNRELTKSSQSSVILSTLAPVRHENPCLNNTACYLEPLNEIVLSEPGGDLLHFIVMAQTLLVDGWPLDYVIGGPEIDLDIVFGGLPAAIAPANVFQWTANQLHPFDILGVPERLGLMLSASSYIAWRISPSLKTYSDMPNYMRPTLLQVSVQHSPWIDFIPWPQLRDNLITHNHSYGKLERSLYRASGYVSVNWLSPPADIFEEYPGARMTLHPSFRRHVFESKNWTFEADVASFFDNPKD